MDSFTSLPWKQAIAERFENEEVLTVFDTHWIKYCVPIIVWIALMVCSVLLLISAGGGVFTGTLLQKVLFASGFLLGTVSIHWFFHRVMSVSMEDIVITKQRFIYLESSLWSLEESHEINLSQVKAVDSKKRGVLQNVLRYGSVSFDTGGSDMNRRIFDRIPHPDRKVRLMTDVIRANQTTS